MTEVPSDPSAASAPPRPGMRRWLGWSGVALALLGWWLSIDLFRLGAGASATNPWLQASCAPAGKAAGSDCLSVLNSRWGRIQPPQGAGGQRVGLPWSAVGAAYFAFVAVWYLFVGPPSPSRRAWHLVILVVVALAAGHSAHFLWVMAGLLHRWCAGCVAVHMVNGLLLGVTLAAFPWRKPPTAAPAHPRARLALASVLAGLLLAWLHVAQAKLLLVAAAAGQLNRAYAEIVDDPAFVRWRYARQPVVDIPLRDDEPFAGDPRAPNTVVAFIDLQCTACRLADKVLADLVGRHGGLLRVAFRHFPQDPACNPQLARGGHPAACRAARATEAARLVAGAAGFARMRKLLYERQAELELDRYRAWAAELGLDAAAFSAALNSPVVGARISSDIELGRKLGLSQVPALFLNGRRVEHWRSPGTWRALLGLEGQEPASQPGPAWRP